MDRGDRKSNLTKYGHHFSRDSDHRHKDDFEIMTVKEENEEYKTEQMENLENI